MVLIVLSTLHGMCVGDVRFRPLTGIMVLIQDYGLYDSEDNQVVSVPLRRLWFLSKSTVSRNISQACRSFRPLTGIMVLICQGSAVPRYCLGSFRPLTGIMVLIKCSKWKSPRTSCICFRPLTGIMVLISSNVAVVRISSMFVSVPLRGLWFLSTIRFPNSFPVHPRSFRPLTGIMVLIWVTYPALRPLVLFVSVPLRGLWFLSTRRFLCSSMSMTCFRPLTGIMVLIRTLYRWLYEAFEMAFCGADHIFSSFFVFYKKMIFKKSFGPEF